jgi:hypothetical protein
MPIIYRSKNSSVQMRFNLRSGLGGEAGQKETSNGRALVLAGIRMAFWRVMRTVAGLTILGPVLLGSLCMNARADQATLKETYSEKYACWWDCPFDLDDIDWLPGVDRDEVREENCDRICAERLRVAASLKLVLNLPTLRHVDLRTVGNFGFSAGGLEFPLTEASKSSSNSVTFPQYREDENNDGEIIQRRVGTVVFSKKGDVLTVSASRVTAGESMVAGQFTHQNGTIHGAINIDLVTARVEVAGLLVEREIPFKALTTLKTNLVRVEIDNGEFEEPEVIEESRTFSTVKVSGTAAWANPTLAVTTPISAQRWSNQVIVASGTVMSFLGEPKVLVQLNRADEWIEVSSTNGLWIIPLGLKPGTNGIVACAVDDSGRFSSAVVVSFVYVRTSTFGLEASPSAAAGSMTGPADGETLEEGVIYRLTPVPAPGYLLEKWELQSPISGTREISSVAAPQLTFVHETNLHIRAYFVPNRFLTIPSKYAGLVRPSAGTNLPADEINQGLITLQLSDKGAIKGSYVTSRKTFGVASQIHPGSGTARLILDAGKVTEATVSLTFDLDKGRWVLGSLTGGGSGWTAVFEAYPFASPDEVLPFIGSHTFTIPGVALPNASSLPAGYGFGTLQISANGSVKGLGAAGDGTSLVFNAPLLKHTDGISNPRYFWPFFQTKRHGEIVLRGFIDVSTTNTLDTASLLHWSKRSKFEDALYPLGFDDARFTAAGGLREWITARYLVPGRGTNAAGFVNGRLTLTGGNLPGQLQFSVSITADDKVTVVGPNPMALTLKFNRATGGFTGTFLHPQTGKTTKLAGAILKSTGGTAGSNAGFGWFPGWNQTGAVILEDADAP